MSSESRKRVKIGSEDFSTEIDVEAILKALKLGDGECAVLPSRNTQENMTLVTRTGETTRITIIRTERHNIVRKRQVVRVIEISAGKVKVDRRKL